MINGKSKKNHQKIAIIHYSSPPVLAGVELVIKDQIDLFLRDNYQVELISGVGKQYRSDISYTKIPEISSQDPTYLKAIQQIKQTGSTKLFDDLVAKIKQQLAASLADTDVVIVHQALTMHFNLALTAALVKLSQVESKECRFIHWTHDSTFFDEKYLAEYKPLAKQYPFNLIATKQPNIKYVAISEFRQQQLSNFFDCSPNEISVIPNGVKINQYFSLSADLSTLVNDLDLFGQDLVAVLPNRILPRKNIEQAVKIIYELKQIKPRTTFIITGLHDYHNPDSQDYFAKIKSYIKEHQLQKNVIFLSEYQLSTGKQVNLETLEVKKLYLLADFLLYPSKIEGFGLQVIEAGLLKTPVVCSNIKPFTETGQQDVLYFDVGSSAKQTAAEVVKFLQSIPTSRAYRRDVMNYSLDNIYKKLIKPLLD